MSDVRRGPQPKKLNTESWVKGRQAVGTKHVKETPPDLRFSSDDTVTYILSHMLANVWKCLEMLENVTTFKKTFAFQSPRL